MALTPPNYTQTPNVVFDKLMRELSEAELRVLLVLVRKTLGWHKIKEEIGLSQIAEITGMGANACGAAAKLLCERGLVRRSRKGQGRGAKFNYELDLAEETPSKNGYIEQKTPSSNGYTGEETPSKNGFPAEQQLLLQTDTPDLKKEEKERKTRKKDAQAEPAPYSAVVSAHFKLHKEVCKTDPLFGAVEGAIVKRLLVAQKVETVIAKLESYYKREHWFTKGKQGRSLKEFIARYNEIELPKPMTNGLLSEDSLRKMREAFNETKAGR